MLTLTTFSTSIPPILHLKHFKRLSIKLLPALAIVFLSLSLSAQKISNIDLNIIREQASASYINLINRYIKVDSSLTIEDYKVIYYGNAFQKNYMSQSISKLQNELKTQYNQGNYKMAAGIGEKLITENPVNTVALFNLMVSFFKIGDTVKAKHYANMYYPLIQTIHRSGTGLTPEQAFVVIQIQDEFQALEEWDYIMVGQMLKNNIDQIEAIRKTRPNYGLPQAVEMHFNLSIPIAYIKDQQSVLQKILNNFTYYWLSYQYAYM